MVDDGSGTEREYSRDPQAWTTAPRGARALAEFRRLYGLPGTTLLQQFAELATLLMRADAAVTLVRGPNGLEWHGARGCQPPEEPIVPRGTLADHAMRMGTPQFVDDDTSAGEHFPDVDALGWRCAAVMPIVVDDVVVAALLVGRTTGVSWGEREYRAFDSLLALEAVRNVRRRVEPSADVAALGDRERIAKLFVRMPIAVCVLDHTGQILLPNESFCALAERPLEELQRRHASEVLVSVTPDKLEEAYLAELLQGRRLGFTSFCALALPSGESRPVRVVAGTVRYEHEGKPAHVLLVEDAKTMEAQEGALREREARLLRAQRRDSLAQLAGGLAHEFNNSLAAIAGLASLLRDDLPAADPRRNDAEDILVVAQSASDLTRRLLDLNAGRLSERATLDLRDVLRGFAVVARRVLPTTIDVQVDLPSGAVMATIDRTHVEQALFGLVLNARDAMPDGGRLALSLETVQTGEGQQRARIGIADSGPGIPAAQRDRLWMPFHTTKPDGAGLGLSFALAIVREHGGDLRLESPPETGAVFAAYLPLAPAPAHRAETTPGGTPRAAASRGRCVLLVEDERLVRSTTSRVLTRAGYAVVTAADGEEALAFFESQPERVDVLVTDLQMPRMSGVDLVTRLRRLRPRLPVIVTSAHPASDQDDQELREHRTARLRKPFPMTALLETLAQLLEEPATP